MIKAATRSGATVGRTTIEIDERLLKEALALSHRKTKKEVVELSLREYVRLQKRKALIAKIGNTDLDLSLEELQRLREGA